MYSFPDKDLNELFEDIIYYAMHDTADRGILIEGVTTAALSVLYKGVTVDH